MSLKSPEGFTATSTLGRPSSAPRTALVPMTVPPEDHTGSTPMSASMVDAETPSFLRVSMAQRTAPTFRG